MVRNASLRLIYWAGRFTGWVLGVFYVVLRPSLTYVLLILGVLLWRDIDLFLATVALMLCISAMNIHIVKEIKRSKDGKDG